MRLKPLTADSFANHHQFSSSLLIFQSRIISTVHLLQVRCHSFFIVSFLTLALTTPRFHPQPNLLDNGTNADHDTPGITLHAIPVERSCSSVLAQDSPLKLFRDAPIDQCDLNLIRAERVTWLNYTQGSYARKIVRCH
jgi:hypothetical protein